MDKGKDRARAKELFRQMTPGEKLEHIMTYYLWQIVGVIAAVVAVILIVNAIQSNHRHRNDLCVSVQEDYAVAITPILEYLADQGGWEENIKYASVVSAGDLSGDGVSQIVVQLSANEMDVIICDKTTRSFIEDDPEAVAAVYDLQDTVLGQYAPEQKGVYVMFLTGPRQEKTEQYRQLLVPAS